VIIAVGQHLFPFRTEKLSPPALMVLLARCGRESKSSPVFFCPHLIKSATETQRITEFYLIYKDIYITFYNFFIRHSLFDIQYSLVSIFSLHHEDHEEHEENIYDDLRIKIYDF
jgi:hypothetical protein